MEAQETFTKQSAFNASTVTRIKFVPYRKSEYFVWGDTYEKWKCRLFGKSGWTTVHTGKFGWRPGRNSIFENYESPLYETDQELMDANPEFIVVEGKLWYKPFVNFELASGHTQVKYFTDDQKAWEYYQNILTANLGNMIIDDTIV